MKITYAVPRYLPHLGGIENHVAALATRACRDGHDVTVLTQQEGPDLLDEEIVDGVLVKRFPSMLSMEGQGISPRLWQGVHALGAQSDIVHAHNVNAASTLGVLLAAPSGRLVVTGHYLGSGEGSINRALHRLYDPSLKLALRKAAAIICVSRAEARSMISHFALLASRVHVISNGVDIEALDAAKPAQANGRVVVVASRLESYKQVDHVLAAMAHLPDDYGLVIAGAGPQRELLGELASDIGAADRVCFVGKLNASEMASWYRRATVVVSMSRRECFGMTLVESLAARCPVVASDIPAHREVIEDAGWDTKTLVPRDADPGEIASAILYASNAHTDFEPSVISWDEVAKNTFCLYEAVLS